MQNSKISLKKRTKLEKNEIVGTIILTTRKYRGH